MPTPTFSALPLGVFSARTTGVTNGTPSSTTRVWPRSAPSRSLRQTPTSCGLGPEKLLSVATYPSETASTVQLTGGTAGQDTLRFARRLYSRLSSLAGYITGTDDHPTDQAREVFDMLQSELEDYQRQWLSLGEDLAAFNRFLDDRGIDPIGLD